MAGMRPTCRVERRLCRPIILDPADSLVIGTAVRVREPERSTPGAPKAGAPKSGG